MTDKIGYTIGLLTLLMQTMLYCPNFSLASMAPVNPLVPLLMKPCEPRLLILIILLSR